jgi:hypothetical protein
MDEDVTGNVHNLSNVLIHRVRFLSIGIQSDVLRHATLYPAIIIQGNFVSFKYQTSS